MRRNRSDLTQHWCHFDLCLETKVISGICEPSIATKARSLLVCFIFHIYSNFQIDTLQSHQCAFLWIVELSTSHTMSKSPNESRKNAYYNHDLILLIRLNKINVGFLWKMYDITGGRGDDLTVDFRPGGNDFSWDVVCQRWQSKGSIWNDHSRFEMSFHRMCD